MRYLGYLLTFFLIVFPPAAHAQTEVELYEAVSAPGEHRVSPFQLLFGAFSALPPELAVIEKQATVRSIERQRLVTSRYYLIGQFTDILRPEFVEDLRKQGIQVGPAVGRGTFLLAVEKTALVRLADIDGIRWFGLLPTPMKAGNVLDERGQPEAPSRFQLRDNGKVRYQIRFHELAKPADIETFLAVVEGEIANPDSPRQEARLVDMPLAALPVAIGSDIVVEIVPGPTPDVPLNAPSGRLVGAATAQSLKGLTGAGVVVGVWEVGSEPSSPDTVASVYNGHVDLAPRSRTAPNQSTLQSEHATNVAGTIASSDRDDMALGIAPAATIHSFDFDAAAPITELFLTAFPTPGTFGVSEMDVSNHSYGAHIGWALLDGRWQNVGDTRSFGSYAARNAFGKDELVRSSGTVLVFGAGNEGDEPRGRPEATGDCFLANSRFPSRCINPHSVGKNVLSIGGINSDKSIAVFSSHGPSLIGRIKPDLVAPGEGMTSPGKYDAGILGTGCGRECYNENFRGTSAAAPVVTGVVALLKERATQLNFVNPPAALFRGLLAHTAEDLGRPGPDFSFGWGLVRADRALDVMYADAGGLITRSAVGNQGAAPRMQSCFFQAPTDGFRVTLAWDDTGGTGLNKDLRLKVIAPEGKNEFDPWVLDPSAPLSPATTGVDGLHTLEIIDIPPSEASAGIWRAEVTYESMDVALTEPYVLIGVNCDPDVDKDGVLNLADNCLETFNPNQDDTDRDKIGDVCDPDLDGDNWLNEIDNCELVHNMNQADTDKDGIGNVCDRDDDNDCVADEEDACPRIADCNYYSADATPGLCGDPCLQMATQTTFRGRAFRDMITSVMSLPVHREFAAELGMVIHYCRADFSVPMEPSCFTTGCPLPDFITDGVGDLITVVAERVDSRRSGLVLRDDGSVTFPPAASGILNGRPVAQFFARHSGFSQRLMAVIESEFGRHDLLVDVSRQRDEIELPPPENDQELMIMSLQSGGPEIRAPMCRGLINDLRERALGAEIRAQSTYNSCRAALQEEARMCGRPENCE
ncbi:MAG: S8 family serine peptidase [Pseudomonadota bacterium]